jgi:hypothetical protein
MSIFNGYVSLRDMFDGGGPGEYGDHFEDGGAISTIANLLMRPRGYNDRMAASEAEAAGMPFNTDALTAQMTPEEIERASYLIPGKVAGFGLQRAR